MFKYSFFIISIVMIFVLGMYFNCSSNDSTDPTNTNTTSTTIISTTTTTTTTQINDTYAHYILHSYISGSTITNDTIDVVLDNESTHCFGYPISTFVDTSNELNVAYVGDNHSINYGKYSGGNWSISDIGVGASEHGYLSLKAGSINNIGLSIFNLTNLIGSINYVSYNGSWSTPSIIGSTFSTTQSLVDNGIISSLAFDSSEVPYIVYSDNSNIYCYKNTGSWVSVPISPAITEVQYCDIAIGSDNNPNIIYSKPGEVSLLRYNSSWSSTTINTDSSISKPVTIAMNGTSAYMAYGVYATIVGTTALIEDIYYNTYINGILSTPELIVTANLYAIDLALDSSQNPYMAYIGQLCTTSSCLASRPYYVDKLSGSWAAKTLLSQNLYSNEYESINIELLAAEPHIIYSGCNMIY